MRILAALALSAALLTGACTTPDGRFDPGGTLGLAAVLAAIGGVAYLATQGNDNSYYRNSRGGSYGGYRGGSSSRNRRW